MPPNSQWPDYCGGSSFHYLACTLLQVPLGSLQSVTTDYLIPAPHGVVHSTPRTDLAFRLRRGWRSSLLPISLGSHLSSVPYCATSWTQATWTCLTLSGTTTYVFVRHWSLALAARGFFMHWLSCSLNVQCACIQMPSMCVACVLNCMNKFPTYIFAASFGQMCFLRPRLHVNSAVSTFARLNCSRCLLAHSILFAAHQSSMVRTSFRSLPFTTKLRW